MTMYSGVNCGTCGYCVALNGSESGVCHLRPPSVHPQQRPAVRLTDWCGDWRAYSEVRRQLKPGGTGTKE